VRASTYGSGALLALGLLLLVGLAGVHRRGIRYGWGGESEARSEEERAEKQRDPREREGRKREREKKEGEKGDGRGGRRRLVERVRESRSDGDGQATSQPAAAAFPSPARAREGGIRAAQPSPAGEMVVPPPNDVLTAAYSYDRGMPLPAEQPILRRTSSAVFDPVTQSSPASATAPSSPSAAAANLRALLPPTDGSSHLFESARSS
jgi:hypothetical protein